MFRAMNCASCHGYAAEGGMGPALNDDYWRYGGTPVEIYKSIYEGRPKGMPAWGVALPPSQIWALTSYIASLGGSQDFSQAQTSRGTNSPAPFGPKPSRSGAGTEGQ
jgi:cytochrome c oxidase cbb3-type subunit 3